MSVGEVAQAALCILHLQVCSLQYSVLAVSQWEQEKGMRDKAISLKASDKPRA